MQINNSISFNSRYNFFQNQRDFLCAKCAKRIVPEVEIKELTRDIEPLKGLDIANILSPYLELMQEKSKVHLRYLVEMASKHEYRDWSFKKLAMLVPDSKIFQPSNFETLKKILNDIHFSVEHVIARNNGGENKPTNYVPMHLGCNISISSNSYSAQLAETPNFLENYRKALLVLKLKDARKEIQLPENYFSEIKEALKSHNLDITSLSDI